MRTRTTPALLAAALTVCGAGIAVAQGAAIYDPAQLPATHGKIAQYSLTPRGDVDGLILTDGTEVHLPPHLGTQLVFAMKPGDAVTIHGLRARAIPMVQAMSVSNDATGKSVIDDGPGGMPGFGGGAGPGGRPSPGRGPGMPGPGGAGQALTAHGRIKMTLHGPRGELNGVLLDDGTIIHLPPPEALRLGQQLAAGATIYVQGDGFDGALGRVIDARSIGPSETRLAQVAGRPPHGGPGMEAPPPPPPPPPPGTGTGPDPDAR